MGRAQAPSPATHPKLIVVLVVDQMRADYIERFLPEWHGGLRRLVDQGAWFQNAAYPYAGTETCPGHATISTGDYPSTHGIVANTWLDRKISRVITCTEDPTVRDFGVSRTVSPGDSPASLLAPGFAEQQRAALPGARVATFSLKARAAIMLAGHQADVVVWQDENKGDWLTSSAYAGYLPGFVRNFVTAHPVDADLDKTWQAALLAAPRPGSRSVDGEGPPAGWGTEFPHPLGSGSHSADAAFVARWRASPFADAYLGALADAAVDSLGLGRGPQTDFLGIGFSATDYIGHTFGPGSREMENQLFELDRTIGVVLDHLDKTVGAGNYVVALTADHGVAPVPEQAKEQGLPAGRVDASNIAARVEGVLEQRLGPGKYVALVINDNLYFEPGVMSRIEAVPGTWPAVQQAILEEPGVRRAFRTGEISQQAGGDAVTHAVKLSAFLGRSGDVVIALQPYWIFGARSGAGGTTHGTANVYDRRVPLVLFGAGVKIGRYTTAASPADIASTLAALCGIAIGRTDGHVLKEAFPSRPRT